MSDKNKKRVSMYIEEQKWKKIKKRAVDEETTASELVRKAIKEKYG